MKRVKDKDVLSSGPAGEPDCQDSRPLARCAVLGARRPRRRGIDIAGFSVVVLLAASVFVAAPAAASTLGDGTGLTPTIESDKADYAPASTVTLTGAGWSSGEAVHVNVNDNVGQTWSYNVDVTANPLGGFTLQFKLPNSFAASYLVTATGASATATTTFTDSNPYSLDQCTNGGVGETPEPCRGSSIQPNGAVETFKNWVNGDANGQKAHWKEGDFIAYRTRLSGLTAGTHTLILHYDTVSSKKHALDYLGSYDATETTSATATPIHANHNSPCLDLVQAGEMESGDCNPTSVPAEHKSAIPVPTLTDCGESEGTAPTLASSPGNVVIFGPTGTSLGTLTYGTEAEGKGSCSEFLSVKFTSPAIDSSHAIVIAWGAHIASEGDWGSENSASAISGSPYHMAIDSLDGTGGSEDHQLATSAIVFTPSITTDLIENSTGESVTGGSVAPGTTVHDTATMTGQSSNAGGKVTYERFTTIDCTGPSTNEEVTVTNGEVPNSADFTPTVPGSYSYKAVYGGTNGPPQNLAAESPCEPLTVSRAKPTIKTSATASVTVGDKIKDTATLSGLVSAVGSEGTVTFRLYSDEECKTEVFKSVATGISSNTSYPSPTEYTTTATGTYYWRAFYSGDANNEAASTPCKDAGESSVVEKAKPTIKTSATASVTVGDKIKDTATLSGLVSAVGSEGTVTFRLYSDEECKTEVFKSVATGISSNTSYPSPTEYTTTATGTYYWRAFYSGDANNEAASTPCKDAGESSVVGPATPAITTKATASVTIGSAIKDTATISGLVNPTGEGDIVFTLYSDEKCEQEVSGSSSTVKAITANGSYDSSPVTPTATGTYYWIATFTSDKNNKEFATKCKDAGESSVVEKAKPTIKTSATASVTVGDKIKDTATLSGLVSAVGSEGTVTFRLYSDEECKTEVFKSVATGISSNTSYPSPTEYTTTATGTYYWRAFYSGDANNEAASTPCKDAGESSVVEKAKSGIETTVRDGNGSVIDNTHPAAATTAVHDTATLSGHIAGFSFGAEKATVTYSFFTNGECKEPAASTQVVSVAEDGTVPDSKAQTLAPGSYSYKATYSGNGYYKAATGACEPFRVVQKSAITNTVLCTFDEDTSVVGSTFRLIFTPSSPGSKLGATNPGQFYYNVFDNAPTGKITFTLPYPFVTQGATPIHVYSGVTMTTVSGQTCLIPGAEIANSGQTVSLGSYGSQTFGSTTSVTVKFSSPTGFAYANIHVEYGLKGTNGWSKGGSSGNDAISSLSFPTILNDQTYLFSETDGSPDSQTASSENVFKKDPGIAGLVLKPSGDPAAKVPVYIYDASHKLVFSTATDQDGWYQWEYKYTGKATTFTVKLGGLYAGNAQTVTIKSNGYVTVNFTV